MTPRELFDEYLTRQKFEHELINRRVTWLLTSQTILFAAYSLGASKNNNVPEHFLDVIAWCGLLSSLFLVLGIVAGARAKWQSWQDYLKLLKLDNMEQQIPSSVIAKVDELRREWGVRTWITKLALLPDILLPILFLGAWTFVLCSHNTA